jgi:hypothetical protein
MLSPEERALLTDLQDRLIELLVQKDNARSRHDELQAAEAQAGIDRLQTECELIREAC